ncbi:hypothetical protein AcV5_007666 [Taiwanofungus camphoratus]|nr:hypothetical protein AcV5_007666 [Antrodia cinnamomea]
MVRVINAVWLRQGDLARWARRRRVPGAGAPPEGSDAGVAAGPVASTKRVAAHTPRGPGAPGGAALPVKAEVLCAGGGGGSRRDMSFRLRHPCSPHAGAGLALVRRRREAKRAGGAIMSQSRDEKTNRGRGYEMREHGRPQRICKSQPPAPRARSISPRVRGNLI